MEHLEKDSLSPEEDDFRFQNGSHESKEEKEKQEVELEKVLLKEAPTKEDLIIVKSATSSPNDNLTKEQRLFLSFERNLSEEILTLLESAVVAPTEQDQTAIMERVLTNLCSFVDSRVLSKLKNPVLTPSTLYSEIVANYICKEFLNNNKDLFYRVTTIASSMSSHSFFHPIFCQLLLPFFSDYLQIIYDDSSKLVSSTVFHQFFVQSLYCIIQGSNRLLMFDLNNYQFKFQHLYFSLKQLLLTLSPRIQPLSIENTKEESNGLSTVENLSNSDKLNIEEYENNNEMGKQAKRLELVQKLIHLFLSDLLTIVGKYYVYYEPESELLKFANEVDSNCKSLDCKHYNQPSNILTLYTILVMSSIHSEETLILYLTKLRQFKDLPCQFDLSIRFKTLLQRLGTSGEPLYPTDLVRREAQLTACTLYPNSTIPNFFVHLFFCLFHPYYIFLWIVKQIEWCGKKSWEKISPFVMWIPSLYYWVIHFWKKE